MTGRGVGGGALRDPLSGSLLPHESRGFIHKRIIGAVSGVVSGGGIAGAISGFARGGSSRAGQSPRPSDAVLIQPVTNRQMRLSFADSAGCERVGGVQFRRKFPGGPCENPFAPQAVQNVPGIVGAVQRFLPGGATGLQTPGASFGNGVAAPVGAPGGAPPTHAVVEPVVMGAIRMRCPKRYVLGIDNKCYFNLPRNSKWRKWRPGRRPKFTGGDLNAIRRVKGLRDIAEDIFEETNPSKKAVARNYRSNWRKPLKK